VFSKNTFIGLFSLDSCSSLDFIFAWDYFLFFYGRSCRQTIQWCIPSNSLEKEGKGYQKVKDKDALESIIKSLGDEEAANIKMIWESFKGKGTTLSSEDWGVSNGIIATLIGQNYEQDFTS